MMIDFISSIDFWFGITIGIIFNDVAKRALRSRIGLLPARGSTDATDDSGTTDTTGTTDSVDTTDATGTTETNSASDTTGD